MSDYLDGIVRMQKRCESRGIPSICSAHPAVLDAALSAHRPVLVESTCNQVNQYGGYTGMTPVDFYKFVFKKAEAVNFPASQLILGGDHLGPSPWQELPAEEAMKKAQALVRAYARAGFTKLHIDTSMKLAGDDPHQPLDLSIIAKRTALLIRAAEKSLKNPSTLRYVIGSEVPIPGGAQAHETGVQVTLPAKARETLEFTRTALEKAGCIRAWERVIALVVQPGVEFGSDFVLGYDPEKATGLAIFSESTSVIYEAHSTDYQKPEALKQLVRDHFAILKVGPALTFACREAVFSLAMMENEYIPAEDRSNLISVLEEAMLSNPNYWQTHYHGTRAEQAFQRKYSLSDRNRYYWNEPLVLKAVEKLKQNWSGRQIPYALASQYLPDISDDLRVEKTKNTVGRIIQARISRVLENYYHACGFPPDIEEYS